MNGRTKGQGRRVLNQSSNESTNNVSENNDVSSQFLPSENSSDNSEKNEEVIQIGDHDVPNINQNGNGNSTIEKKVVKNDENGFRNSRTKDRFQMKMNHFFLWLKANNIALQLLKVDEAPDRTR